MFKNHVTRNLSAYLQGELSPDELLRIQSHLRDCSGCRNAFEEIRFGAGLASMLETVKAPESIWRGIQIARESRPVRQSPLRGFASAAGGAAFAAMMALVVLMHVFLRAHGPNSPAASGASWEVASVRGTAQIGSQRFTGSGHLRPGESLQTNANSEAEVRIADIGQLDLDPNSRIRLLSSDSSQHRIALERGRMTARTWAPPRLFVVETPSSTAVDLGCIYSCEVQRDGSTLLHVTLGLVALDFHGRETIIPAGAFCRTRPGGGVGTPYFDDSSDRLQAALNVVDFGSNDSERARQLDIVLQEARPRDTLTLWNLIPRLREPLRAVVVDRMSALVPRPENVTRDGVLALDSNMMDAWKDALERVW